MLVRRDEGVRICQTRWQEKKKKKKKEQVQRKRKVCGVVWCGVVWCGVVWCGLKETDCTVDCVGQPFCLAQREATGGSREQRAERESRVT